MVKDKHEYNTIVFEPLGTRTHCDAGMSLLECAQRNGIGINSICGGHGTCGTCKIQLTEGKATPYTEKEDKLFTSQQLKNGWRLACQTFPESDCKIYIPPASMTTAQRTQTEGLPVSVQPEPVAKAFPLDLPPPSIQDLMADDARIFTAIQNQYGETCHSIDIETARTISPLLRSWEWHCQTTVRNGEIIALLPPRVHPLGLAIDLGSTKLAGYLVDLSNGETLASKGTMNPQISFAEDIIGRMQRAVKSPQDAAQLQRVVVQAIAEMAAELCREAGTTTANIVDAVIVGNTVMHHLLLGLPTKQLAWSPFLPAVSSDIDIKARDVGITLAPGAYIHMLPNIAGYVGADHVAMLLAVWEHHSRGCVIAMDIGTNTEISLIKDDAIIATSCASGPAFEGGHISHGMRAAEGAIEKIQIIGDDVSYQVIGESRPVGLCGSAILDAIAQLFHTGIIDSGGRITAQNPRVRSSGKQKEFVIFKGDRSKGESDITVTQGDIREIQLAKAAIYSGIRLLLNKSGTSEQNVDRVIIAGAFGTYLDIESAIAIGMLPQLPVEHFIQVGNAAGAGARMALLSATKRAEARSLASKVQYLELATTPEFNSTFIQASYLGPYSAQHTRG